MKKILSILILPLLFSCSGILDMAPDGRTNFEDIFNDNTRTAAYLNTCYSYIQNHGLRYNNWARGPALISDEAWASDDLSSPGSLAPRMYNGNASASDHPILNYVDRATFDGDYWNQYWEAIRKCTFFLMNIDDANVTSENDRNRWRAEAHLLRAYYYSELLRWFGCGLPIMKDEVWDWTTDFSSIERADYYDVVQFILEDCQAALDSHNLPWRITTDGEMGRMSKAVAEAIRSRMILYAASPLYNDGQNHWEEAYTVTKAARDNLEREGYRMYSTVRFPADFMAVNSHLPNAEAAMYNEYFCYNADFNASPVDTETIYQKKTGFWFANVWDQEGIGAYNFKKSGTNPSQELVDSYETLDGEPILDLAKPYLDEKHTQPNYNPANTAYDPADPYANRDPRFYATVYYNGSQRYCFWPFNEPPESLDYPADAGFRSRTIWTYVGEPYTGISETTSWMTRTGYYHRKFLHPTTCLEGPIVQAPAHKHFRYGEVLLNFAEAAAEAGGAARLREAWDAVNEVRRRVNMPDLPLALQSDQKGLILRIRNERRVELALEEHRYFDVRRWADPAGDLSATDKWITAMEITRNADGSFSYNRRPVRTQERACYTNRYLKVPIPLRDVNIIKEASGQNWQNPGW